MVEEVTVGLIGVILAGIGVIVTLIFNIRATNQNTKTRHYNIIKDLTNKFKEINEQKNPINWIAEIVNFASHMRLLDKEKIISKKIFLKNHENIFRWALWTVNNMGINKESHDGLIDFCKKNNIQEEKIPKTISDLLHGVTNISFSSNANTKSSIYQCPKCSDFFGEQAEFKEHLAINSCNLKNKET